MKNSTEKLSKRNGDASYQDLVEKGYLTEAVLNYIALLGWSPGGEKEVFTLQEMVEAFKVSGISKAPAIFDPQKLNHINAEWIRGMSPEEFHTAALPWMRKTLKRKDIDTEYLASLLQARCEVLGDISEQVDFFDQLPDYSTELYVSKKMKTNQQTSLEMLKAALPVLEALEAWTVDSIHDALFSLIASLEVKNGYLLWPLRIAVSGKQFTPGGGVEIAFLVGKNDALQRIRTGISKLEQSQ